MRIVRLRVQNFRCVEDSDEFTVGQLVCLVGKNESGKTALLEALYKLNPVLPNDGTFQKREFPRRSWADYGSDPQPNVLTSVWSLDTDDVETVDAVFGPGLVVADQEVVITKGYDNTRRWSFDLDEKAAVQNLLDREHLDAVEKGRLRGNSNLGEARVTLNALETPSPKEQSLLAFLNENVPEGDLSKAVSKLLADRLPIFVYFPDYERMDGRVALTALQDKIADGTVEISDEIFVALLHLVGTTPEDIEAIGQSEDLIAELERVQTRISRQIFSYWSQNRHLRVNFRFSKGRPEDTHPYDGWVFETRVENLRHEATINFDERSSGFTWFFSFLVWFSYLRKKYGDRLYLLLDEPGLSLHARAQHDLLRFVKTELLPSPDSSRGLGG